MQNLKLSHATLTDVKEINDAFKNQGPGAWPIAPNSVDGSLAARRFKFTGSLKGKFNSNSSGTDSAYSLQISKMWNLPKPNSYT